MFLFRDTTICINLYNKIGEILAPSLYFGMEKLYRKCPTTKIQNVFAGTLVVTQQNYLKIHFLALFVYWAVVKSSNITFCIWNTRYLRYYNISVIFKRHTRWIIIKMKTFWQQPASQQRRYNYKIMFRGQQGSRTITRIISLIYYRSYGCAILLGK